MYIDSRYPIRHTLPPGGSGERARDYIKQGLGLSPLPQGERQRNHLFALSRTLRIRQLHGLGFSTVESISPLRAIVDDCSALSDFHGVSRPQAPDDGYRGFGMGCVNVVIIPAVGMHRMLPAGGRETGEPQCPRWQALVIF